MKQKILFRADAGPEIGYGHFIRSLALADMLKDDFDCTFFTQSPTDYQQEEVAKVCKLVSLPADNSRFNLFLDKISGNEIVVLDNYFFTTEYQQQIKDKGCKLVCIDDMHNKHYVANVVINQGLTDESLFDCEVYTKLCLGLDYALLRKPFLIPYKNDRISNRWFVSFGGSDNDNLTAKFVELLENISLVNQIVVVIGDSYKYQNTLRSFKKVIIKKNLTASQMHDEMAKSEYALLPCSTVCIEALSCGCKIVSGYYVENQREGYEEFANKGYIYKIGNLYEFNDLSFIQKINKNRFIHVDFKNVQNNYVELFKSLINENR